MSSRRFSEEIMMTTNDYEPRTNECKKVIPDVPETLCSRSLRSEVSKLSLDETHYISDVILTES
jgi:hypothetical protein